MKYIIDSTGLTIIPYIEPDRKAIEDEVWEFARRMISISGKEVSEMWGCTTNFGEVMHNTSYQEAKSKYEAWLKQKDEIKVGDEVEYESCGEVVKFIVTGVNGSRVYGFKSPCEYDDVGDYSDIDGLHKTGRHFPEVAELLQKMRGEDR